MLGLKKLIHFRHHDVVLLVRKLAKVTSAPKVNESRGPRVDANEKCNKWFLKSNNIKDIKNIKKKKRNK